ncbi:hypothetical protein PCANC_08798 [Puccinia coronata f. sp. avenae]|uniref:RSE1/DDB1/CPSF1 second beta-propeller domain-containing protein n=1 Tax=Puccinia coronata f. sp. avenae TaxID=200324 RepID=A0A2N5SZT3_9BASI|nr:hypothetical protein PCANC_10919 [Puccinia coronata f. sp. avenae]PLW45707.1 hypothetical protein PCASD_07058 [Puccinia coronata f. sp. avenae]PLW46198.1 hypothetical protein PCANC_08798 [Puccinia coronata f. sp. avenae]
MPGSGGPQWWELIYFKLDLDRQLNRYQEQKVMSATITSLSLLEVPKGRQRTNFLAIGLENLTIPMCLEALTAIPSSICIAKLLDSLIDKNNHAHFVNIGLANDVLLHTVLDSPTKLLLVKGVNKMNIIALLLQTWVNYKFQNLLHFNPISYNA